VTERLIEPVPVLADLVQARADQEVRFCTAHGADRLAVVDDSIERVRHGVDAGLGRGKLGRVESLLRGVAQVRELRLQVVCLPVRPGHGERCAFQVDLGRQLEIAMVVAVVAEHQVDVDRVAGSNQVCIGLYPGVVGRGRAHEQA
jgi:hypothetical protein